MVYSQWIKAIKPNSKLKMTDYIANQMHRSTSWCPSILSKARQLAAVGLASLPLVVGNAAQAVTIPVAQTDNWNINVSIDADWGGIVNAAKTVQRGVQHAWDHVFGRDPEEQQIFTINGKAVVVVRVTGPRDTRISNNINFDPAWKGDFDARILVANVPSNADPKSMPFQQKYDEDWGSDPNIGPVLRHGDVVRFNPGHGRYFAKRSDTVFTGAVIIIADARLTPAELAQLPGLRVSKF